jgi:hypothetical protein
MKNNFVLICLCAVMVGMLNQFAGADLIVLTPSQDNSVFAESNNSAGAKIGLYVGVTNGAGGSTIRRAFMQFNLAGIPAGSTINSVTLKLERDIQAPTSGLEVLDLHPVLQSWGEGTSTGNGAGGLGYAPSAGSVTWIHRFFSTQSWTTPGGDIGPVSGSILLDSTGQVLIPSQPGMVADVQNWINNPASNFGWALKYNNETTTGTARRFSSREVTTVSNRPTLTVDFSIIPEPNSCFLIGVASLIASTYRSRYRRQYFT